MSNYTRIYLQNYSYFLTVLTHGREPILIDNIELLRDSFRRSKKRYDYKIDAIVVLPDHFHMIITPAVAKEYSKIITYIKRAFVYGLDEVTKENAKATLSASTHRRQHSGIWQRRFYEHTIRDEKDMFNHLAYMENNPIKHGLVEKTEDWKYSSFVGCRPRLHRVRKD